jgi:hypothetical protein
MSRKKSNQKQSVRRLMEKLARREFGENLMGIMFHGPYEDEDMDVDLLLREEPLDDANSWHRIHQELEKAGFFVLFGWDVWEELEEDEKEDWQSLWQPVNARKAKTKNSESVNKSLL